MVSNAYNFMSNALGIETNDSFLKNGRGNSMFRKLVSLLQIASLQHIINTVHHYALKKINK